MEDQTEIDLLAEQVKNLPYDSLVELEQRPKALPIVGNYKQQMQNAYSGIQDASKRTYAPSPELTEQISGARADYDKANQPMQEDMLSKIITSFGPAILGGLSGEAGKLAQLPASKQANELYATQRKEQQGEQERNRARALKRYEELVGSKKAEREAFDKGTQREIEALKAQASGARDMAGLDLSGQRIAAQEKGAERRAKKEELGGMSQVDYIPGYEWNQKTPINKGEIAKMQKAVADKESLQALLESVKTKVSESSDKDLMNPFSEKSKSIKADLRDAQLLYKGPAFAELGVLAGPDLQILEDVLEKPSVNNIAFGGGKKALLDRYGQAASRIDNKLSNTLKSRGFTRAGQKEQKPQEQTKEWNGRTYKLIGDEWVAQ